MGHSSKCVAEGRTFYPFGRLPKELRLAIWEIALPGPRIVPIWFSRLRVSPASFCARVCSNKSIETQGNGECFDHKAVERSGSSPMHSQAGRIRCDIPAMLLTCRESAELCSLKYTKSFGNPVAVPGIWFDFKNDTLYLDWAINIDHTFMSLLSILGPDVARVEKLAIRLSSPYLAEASFQEQMQFCLTDSQDIMRTIAPFTNIKKVTFVTKHHDHEDMSNLVWMDVFDMNAAMIYYQQPYRPQSEKAFDEMKRSNADLMAPPVIVRYGQRSFPEFDTLRGFHQQAQWAITGTAPQPMLFHTIYEIERKIITTHHYMEPLKALKASHDEAKELYQLPLQVRYVGFDIMHTIARANTTFAALVQKFKRVKRIDEGVDLVVFMNGIRVRPEALVFECVDVVTKHSQDSEAQDVELVSGLAQTI